MNRRARTKPRSISLLLKNAFIVITLVFIVSITSCLYYIQEMSSQYNRLVGNAAFANKISTSVRAEISDEIWNIVVGRKEFEDGTQYQIIDALERDMNALRTNTLNTENLLLLDSAQRATVTLRNYVDILHTQISSDDAVSANQAIMQEINNVSGLINSVLLQYSYGETNVALEINETIQTATKMIGLLLILLIATAIAFMLVSYRSLNRSISEPIKELEEMSMRIAMGDLETRTKTPKVLELVSLSHSLNNMAEQIQRLIDTNIAEQKKLQKAELRSLQAQITPHFLYNTFDTIVWLAEGGYNDDVVNVTMAFSDFYRIALSHGMDWIPLELEVEHVRNYLTIQSYRYQEILDYHIYLDERIAQEFVLKLILQPLVENAIYHGIKNKRETGTITVSAYLDDENAITCMVSDTGIGMSEEKRNAIYQSFHAPEPSESFGYGMYNVNKRIQLYYEHSDGLKIESKMGEGTTISFRLPRKQLEAHNHV